MVRSRHLTSFASAAIAIAALLAASPEVALASCPGRTQGPAGWQAGAYKSVTEAWGVHADLEGYDPVVPLTSSGADSIVTIMLHATGHNWWLQPGWWKVNNMAACCGFPNGYHSAVQFFDPSGSGTDFFGRDFFQGYSDPVPAPGTLARYAATTSLDGQTGLFAVDVKLAGLCCVTYETAVQYDDVQIFGEINNAIAQFPGDTNDHDRLRTVGWRNANLVWHGIDDTNGTSQPQLGWSHTAGTYDYDIWDKATGCG